MRRLLALVALALLAPIVPAALFASPEDVAAALADVAAHPRVHVETVALSEERRPIYLAVVAEPPVASPADVGDRVVTFLYTQQHGNEPAGTPAALRLLRNLTGALGDRVLANQVVLVMPQVNPDGAVAGTRGNAQDTDTNRDHLNLTSAAARAVHRVVEAWKPALAVDHHEYSGVGTGLGPVRTYDFDATILWPKHANVDAAIVDLSIDVNEAMREALEAEGFSVGDYGTLTAAGVPVQELAGGPQPSIARNHYGLHHAGSLLVESRVDDSDPVRGDGAARRIRVHEVTMEAALGWMAANADAAKAARAGSAERALSRDLALDAGGSVALPGWGWRVADADARDVLAAHGLPIAETSVAAAHPLRHHAGLLLEAQSPWRIATGERLDASPLGAPAPEERATPSSGFAAVAAVVFAVALLLPSQRLRRR